MYLGLTDGGWLERAAAGRARTSEEGRVRCPTSGAYYWIKESVDRADSQRRNAEDNLFVGSPARSRRPEQYKKINTAGGREQSYCTAIACADRVARAYVMRDKAWAAIPYLGQWLFGRFRTSPFSASTILLAHPKQPRVGRGLGRIAPAGQVDSRVRRRAAMWSRNWTCCSELQRQCCPAAGGRRLRFQDPPRDMRGPAGAAADRRTAKRGAKPIPGNRRRGPGDSTTASVELRRSAVSQYLQRLTRLDRHFVLSILGGAQRERTDGQSPPPKKSPVSGGIEDQIQAIAAEGETIGNCSRPSATKRRRSSRRPMRDCRPTQRLACGDGGRLQAWRISSFGAAAPLLPEESHRWRDPATDPERRESRLPPAPQLRLIDLRSLLVWHCQRALEDFWGPAPGGHPGRAVLRRSGQDYLRASEQLCPQAKSVRCGQVDLKDCSMSAEGGAVVSAPSPTTCLSTSRTS